MLASGPFLRELLIKLPVKNKNSVRFTFSEWKFDEVLEEYTSDQCETLGAKKNIVSLDPKEPQAGLKHKKTKVGKKHLNLINSAVRVTYIANQKNILTCLENLENDAEKNFLLELFSSKTFYNPFYVKSQSFEKMFEFKTFSTKKRNGFFTLGF